MSRSSEYHVDRVVGKRVQRGRVYYLIKWKDYGEEENTWEPEEHCSKARKMIMEYEATVNGSLDEPDDAPRPRKKIQKRRHRSDIVRIDFQNGGPSTSNGNPRKRNRLIVSSANHEQESNNIVNDNTAGRYSTRSSTSTATEANGVQIVGTRRSTEVNVTVSCSRKNKKFKRQLVQIGSDAEKTIKVIC